MTKRKNRQIQRFTIITLSSALMIIMLSACGGSRDAEPTPAPTTAAADAPRPDPTPSPDPSAGQETNADADAEGDAAEEDMAEGEGEGLSDEDEVAAVAYSGRPGSVLWSESGCVAYHNMGADQTADERGPVGPNMGNLHATAGDRVAGQDAAEYVYTSIVDPSAYVNEGYIDGVMPKIYTELMSEEELRELTAWLLDPTRE